jgi:hypothetical protein
MTLVVALPSIVPDSGEAKSLRVTRLNRTIILRANILKVLWTGRNFNTGSDVSILLTGIGLGWGLRYCSLGCVHRLLLCLLSSDG